MFNVKELLEKIKKSPYEEISVCTPHTGVVSFAVTEEETRVHGPEGKWKEKPGTLLAHLERERNNKLVHALQKGRVVDIQEQYEGKFVEAGTRLMTIRHYLTREEVQQIILRKTLALFHAPEKAAYYFRPEIDSKIKTKGSKSVRVKDGDELFIVSRMKREAPLAYSGPDGLIYTVYFNPNQNVEQGQPLIGVCPEDQMDSIKDVLNRVQSEWEEKE